MLYFNQVLLAICLVKRSFDHRAFQRWLFIEGWSLLVEPGQGDALKDEGPLSEYFVVVLDVVEKGLRLFGKDRCAVV